MCRLDRDFSLGRVLPFDALRVSTIASRRRSLEARETPLLGRRRACVVDGRFVVSGEE